MRNKYKSNFVKKTPLRLVEASHVPSDFNKLRVLVMVFLSLAAVCEVLLIWPGIAATAQVAKFAMVSALGLTTALLLICSLIYFGLYRRSFTSIDYLGMVSVTGTWCFSILAVFLVHHLDNGLPLRVVPLCICVQLMALLSASSSEWLKVGNSDGLYDISNCEWSLQSGYKVERRAHLKIIYGGLQSAVGHRQSLRESKLGRGG